MTDILKSDAGFFVVLALFMLGCCVWELERISKNTIAIRALLDTGFEDISKNAVTIKSIHEMLASDFNRRAEERHSQLMADVGYKP